MRRSFRNTFTISWPSWPSTDNIQSSTVRRLLLRARRRLTGSGTFEYEEYISLKSINDPNEGYETISDLMTLQDQIDAFQKLIFSHFRSGANNECRIAALVPLVQESYGIYKFITSMLRAMHTSKHACP